MLNMSRRSFLSGLMATSAAAVAARNTGFFHAAEIVSQKVAQYAAGNIIEGETFVLRKPLVISDLHGFILKSCTFEAAPDFEGDYLADVKNCKNGVIIDCTFNMKGSGAGGLIFA